MELLFRQLQFGAQQIRSLTTSALRFGGPPVHGPPVGKHSKRRHASIRKLTRLRCVDNSPIGKQAMAEGNKIKVIHIYNKKCKGEIGNTFSQPRTTYICVLL